MMLETCATALLFITRAWNAPIERASKPMNLTTPREALNTGGVKKIALIHEWLTTYAGSDKVLAVIISLYPDADLFCLIDHLPESDRKAFAKTKIKTSFLQRIPFSKYIYRYLFPLMPLAIEQHDLSDYDLIISNSHAVAKGVLTGPDQLHICYCYTPIRYAWDFQHQYLEELKLTKGFRSALVRYLLHRMRIWDSRTANGVDHFIACSTYIARRIWKVYRRPSTVIYPCVEVDDFAIEPGPRDNFYFTCSRLVPYKKVQLIVRAFALMHNRKLVVIGTGPLYEQIKAEAASNVSVLGFQPFPVLLEHMQKARCFLFASEEDFGIAPLEAQACGTPVVAFGKGGARDTVVDGVTGLFFWQQSPQAICEAVERFESVENSFDPDRIREHSMNFSTASFKKKFSGYVASKWSEHQQAMTSYPQDEMR
jgi:glycosyltransferase involved in cell wall biosynthesis